MDYVFSINQKNSKSLTIHLAWHIDSKRKEFLVSKGIGEVFNEKYYRALRALFV